MKHLMFEDFIEYVSANVLDDDTIALFSKVNTHIRECEECRNLVNAFQKIYDTLTTEGICDKNDRYFCDAFREKAEKENLLNEENNKYKNFKEY